MTTREFCNFIQRDNRKKNGMEHLNSPIYNIKDRSVVCACETMSGIQEREMNQSIYSLFVYCMKEKRQNG